MSSGVRGGSESPDPALAAAARRGSIIGPDPRSLPGSMDACADECGPEAGGSGAPGTGAWHPHWVQGRPRGRFGLPAALIWLAFIVFPLVDAVTNKGPLVGHILTILGAAVFVAGYVWLVVRAFGTRPSLRAQSVCGGLALIAIVLTLADRPGWGFLFTYVAACSAVIVVPRWSFPSVLVLTGLAAVCSALGGGGASGAFGYGASTVGIGLLMVLMRDLRTRNAELLEARAELAHVAVAQERERFARDLHDLLGHSLSVIALKAELAGKLMPGSPERAAREVGEVEAVARQALSEVRQAVGGYRRPTLDDELAGARLALSAAGIESEIDRPAVRLDPEVEGVLAWAVREGATNVIRHSGARHCILRITTGLGTASVEVLDDGRGCAAPTGDQVDVRVGGRADVRVGGRADVGVGGRADGRVGGPTEGRGGNGLAGLDERAAAIQAGGDRGWIEAGTRAEGGFRLAVSVPVGRRG